MQKEKRTVNANEESKYYGAIPKKVLENVAPEIRIQYFFWDELLKRQIQLHPEMFPPLVEEIFKKEYPEGTEIKILSTEYVVDKVYKEGEKRIESIRSDLLIQLGGKDLYHMECQMKKGGDIAVRMLEYDMNAALVHGLEWVENPQKIHNKNAHPYKYSLKFPKSAILYLDSTERTPCEESCTMIFPDGTEYEYSVPILKVQGYTPETMAKKRLNILFPFSPIRFRRRLDAIWKERNNSPYPQAAYDKMEALKKDLTKFVSDCIMIINREEENGTLKDTAVADLVEFMGRACDQLFNKEPELLREVHEVMEPVIKLYREELEEQKDIAFKLYREEIEEQKAIAFKLYREEMEEQKAIAFKLYREEVEEQKAIAFKLMEEQKLSEIKLIEEQKLSEIKLIEKQKNRQLEIFIQNYIQQCKEEGKRQAQTEQAIQNIFSLTPSDAKIIMEKWW